MIDQLIVWCARNRVLVFIGAIALAIWGAWAMLHTPLDAVPDISDVQVIVATEWAGRSPDLIEDQVPEVERVFGTIGRGTTPTDNSPMGMVNTTIVLKPREQWRPGMTFERLQAEMDEALQFPGFPNTWTQPIRNRLDMLFTGIKTPVGIKILGPDLAVIQRLGQQLEGIISGVEDTRSVYAERVTQGYFTDIQIRRDAIARHGLTVDDVQMVVQTAIGGENATQRSRGGSATR